MFGYHLHSDAPGFSVSDGDHGLDDAQGSGLEPVQYHGCGLLHEALKEALARYGTPEIFNTDQGSQFTTSRFTEMLQGRQIRISMDGRGRWMDNVFIEWLWRSLKYECVYLHAFETGSELRAGLAKWIGHYNSRGPHSALAGRTPDEAYHGSAPTQLPGLTPAAVSVSNNEKLAA